MPRRGRILRDLPTPRARTLSQQEAACPPPAVEPIKISPRRPHRFDTRKRFPGSSDRVVTRTDPYLLLATARKPQSPPKLKSIPQPNDNYGFGCTAIPKIVQSTTNICYLCGQFHALDLMAVIG